VPGVLRHCGCYLVRGFPRERTLPADRGGAECVSLRLCEECSSLIENHDTIEMLNTVLANLNNTIQVRGCAGGAGRGACRGEPAGGALGSDRWAALSERSALGGFFFFQNVERTRAIPEEARAAMQLVQEHGDTARQKWRIVRLGFGTS
jgi:hypothetical protein